MEEYNSQYFDTEDMKKDLHIDLIKHLLKLSKSYTNKSIDIHIRDEDFGIYVEWATVSEADHGKFEYVPEDSYVMIEKIFPDNHTEMCYDEDDYQERLKEFLEENPGWEKTSYNTWTNVEENKKFAEYFAKSLSESTKEE